MHLLDFAPELLIAIFRHLGADFFRGDVGRLTVCKSWYSLAWMVLFEHLHLSNKSLPRFVKFMKRTQSNPETVTKTIDITLKSRHDDQPGIENDRLTSLGYSEADYAWTHDLNLSLVDFSEFMTKCSKVRSMTVVTLRPVAAGPPTIPRSSAILLIKSVDSLVSATHLTELNLDVHGLAITSSFGGTRPYHVCSAVNKQLRNLRRLRCRLAHICPALLDQDHGDKSPLPLKYLIINMAIPNEVGPSPYQPPVFCERGLRAGLSILGDEILGQMGKLAARMDKPDHVRLLWFNHLPSQMHTYDVITRRYMKIKSEAPWEADGEVEGQNEGDDPNEITEDVDPISLEVANDSET